MRIIHLFIVILLIVLVYFFYKPRILEGYGGHGGGGHGRGGWHGSGGWHGGGGYGYGHGRGGWYGRGYYNYNNPWYYPSFLFAYPCKNGCVMENGVMGCPFAGNGINDCVFASDCYGC